VHVQGALYLYSLLEIIVTVIFEAVNVKVRTCDVECGSLVSPSLILHL
jgi:hypothetical protein